MPVMMMGSIGSYTKTMKLQTQWNLKKQSGDLTSHKKSLDEWLKSSSASTSSNDASPVGQGGDSKLRTIQAKVDAGKKLTAQEKAYLKEKDPETYADLEAEEQEQRIYERKLKQCRTKDDVQRLKMAHVGTSLAKVNAVKNDPNISLEKKLRIAKQELRRCNNVEESTREFIRRGDYEKLPTDQEYAEAEREEASQDTPEAENTEPADQDTKEASDAADTQAEEPVKARDKKPEKPDIRTESPEQRKTRRAKAQAAYAYIKSEHDQDVDALVFDEKA